MACDGVLIVEDDNDIRTTLEQVLASEGYKVAAATNGSEALDLLRDWVRTTAPLPCLILLDLMMPVMDGWKFREQQTSDPQLAEIPVVVLTADGRAQAKAEMLTAAAGLAKPVRLDKLLRTVSEYC